VNLASTTTNAALLNAIKVNRIDIYSAGGSAAGASSPLTTGTITLEWLSTYGPSKFISDTTVGSASVAMISSKSPVNSLASAWSLSGINESDVLFSITCPAQSIIDVYCSVVLMDGTNSRLPSTTASGTVGFVYHTYLDGPRAGAVFQPLGIGFLN